MNIYLWFSLLILVLGIILLREKNVNGTLRYVSSALVALTLSLQVIYLVSDYFTGAGIDESVIYHLSYGIQGAGFGAYQKLILLSLLALVVIVAITIVTWRLLRPVDSDRTQVWYSFAHLAFPLALILSPGTQDLISLYQAQSATDAGSAKALFSKYYASPKVALKDNKRRNLIYIYLEGLENTYFDETIFPGLVPQLKSLKSEGVSFPQVYQMPGTGWTIAGMTASQCGIPLVTSSDGNAMSGMDSFLSNAHCLGDTLSDLGYSLSYLGGASLEFAGKGNFYRSHGFSTVKGRDELTPLLSNKKYVSQWGLYDDSLFTLLYGEFERLSKMKQPFGLFGLTLDTHPPFGHPSKSCEAENYADGSNPMLNAVHCTDKLVSEFISRVRSSEFADDTLIVISSDHLALRGASTSLLNKGDRKNLFFVLTPEKKDPKIIARMSSMFDVSATILSFLGFDVERFGLGVNLFSENRTLVELEAEPSKVVKNLFSEMKMFWELPSGMDGVLVNPQKSVVEMDNRSFKYPALMEFDSELNVTDIRFEHNGEKKIVSYFFENKENHPILWIDACRKISMLNKKLGTRELCLFAGIPGSDIGYSQPLRRMEYFSEGRLRRLFSAISEKKSVISSEKYDLKLDLSKDQIHYAKNGNNSDNVEKVTIRSPGSILGGDAYILQSPQGVRISMGSGLTVLGLSNNETPQTILRVDPCKTDGDEARDGAFVKSVRRHSGAFSDFAVVVNDAGHCGDLDLEKLFLDSPLRMRKLEQNIPYIAVIDSDLLDYEEHTGNKDGGIAVILEM